VSALVERALAEAGLVQVLEARRAGTLDSSHVARLHAADLLALGALADRIRAHEVGDIVRVYTDAAAARARDTVVVFPRDGGEARTGLELLRDIAIARIVGPPAARVRVDWTRAGLELAQVALGFGANELAGAIASKRGLPITDGEMSGTGKRSALQPMQLVKKRELADFIRRGGRRPVFVAADGATETIDDATTPAEATEGI
jgi:2-iminoacetate synthase ThiH